MKYEAIARERKRLAELKMLGYDTEAAEKELDEYYELVGKPKEVMKKVESEQGVIPLTSTEISKINQNNPYYKNKKVEVVGGRSIGNRVFLDIKYPNAEKVYTGVDADLVTADQIDIKSNVLFSTPDGKKSEIKGRELLKGSDLANEAKVLNTFNELLEIDNTEETAEHAKRLRKVLKSVVNPLIGALPEMTVRLDEEGQRNGGFIEISGDTAEIQLTKNAEKPAYNGEMSLVENFVHELTHAATYWALRSNDPRAARIKNRLVQLHKLAMKKLTWEHLLPEVSVNPEVEREIAKATYKYINGNVEEFMAYAVTNKSVINAIKDIDVRELKEEPKGFIDKLVYLLDKMVGFAVDKWRNEPKGMKADKLAIKLVDDLVKINNEVRDVKSKYSVADKIDEWIDVAEDKIKEIVKEIAGKQLEKAIEPRPVGKGKIAEIVWVGRNITTLLNTKEGAPLLRLVLSRFGLSPDGTVQDMLQKLRDTDEYQDVVEQLGLASLQIDKNRETTANAIDGLVTGAFKTISKKVKKLAYQSILALDGAALIKEHGMNAKEYYANEQKRVDRLQELKDKIAAKSGAREYLYYVHQIEGLAKYMHTGKAGLIQLKNAEAIARMAGTKYAKSSADKELKKWIDEAASLEAIGLMEAEARDEVGKLMEAEAEGVQLLADMRNGFEEYMETRETEEERLNRPKGYVRETYDRYVVDSVRPVADRKEMESKGYKLVKVLPRAMVGTRIEMALYVSTSMLQLPYNRSAVRFTGHKQQGRTLYEQRVKSGDVDAGRNAYEDLKDARKLANTAVESVMNGKTYEDNEVIAPHVNEKGIITDYRYNVETADKIKYLKMSMSMGEAMGRTWSHQVDVEESKGLNDVAWQEMMVDMGTNYIGSEEGLSGDPYTVLSAESSQEKIRDILRIMPTEYKEKFRKLKQFQEADIKEVTVEQAKEFLGEEVWNKIPAHRRKNVRKYLAEGKVAVRTDMLTKVFGFRDLSIVNAPGIKHLPKEIKNVVRLAENIWKEIVALYSVNVVIKTLAVPMENVISNFIQVTTKGHSLQAVYRAHVEGWKGLNEWRKDEHRLTELVGLMHAYPNEKKYKNEYEGIQARMEMNPVKPLVDAGLYQHITEDIGTGDFSSSSRFANWANEKMDGWPTLIKTGVNYLFVTEQTGLFRALQKFVMYGDFIARYSQYVLGVEKYKRKNPKASRTEVQKVADKLVLEVTRSFVNYANPDSAVWQYVQDIGAARFTKYGIGIQKVIKDLAMDHPIKFAMSIAAQEGVESATGWNPASIDEMSWAVGHSLFTPGPGGIVKSLMDNAVPWVGNVK